MKAPRLNRRLLLEAPQQIADGSGGFQMTWQSLGTLWADVSTRAGRETTDVGAPVSRVTYRIIVRAAVVGDPARPSPDQRFREGNRVFTIKAVAENDTNARFLTCFAVEDTAV